jgi:hypothetical protein
LDALDYQFVLEFGLFEHVLVALGVLVPLFFQRDLALLSLEYLQIKVLNLSLAFLHFSFQLFDPLPQFLILFDIHLQLFFLDSEVLLEAHYLIGGLIGGLVSLFDLILADLELV